MRRKKISIFVKIKKKNGQKNKMHVFKNEKVMCVCRRFGFYKNTGYEKNDIDIFHFEKKNGEFFLNKKKQKRSFSFCDTKIKYDFSFECRLFKAFLPHVNSMFTQLRCFSFFQ